MNEKEIARLVNANSKMSYTLGFVYGGLNEIIRANNLTGEQHLQLMALIQMLHRNCNEIFYSHIGIDPAEPGTDKSV